MNEHRQQLIAELNELYRRHYCKDGKCPCLADCRSGMGSKKFLCDYATRVGVARIGGSFSVAAGGKNVVFKDVVPSAAY